MNGLSKKPKAAQGIKKQEISLLRLKTKTLKKLSFFGVFSFYAKIGVIFLK